MSLLIDGMKMPNNCRDCPLEDAYDGYNCRIIEKSANWGLEGRPSWCPLIPIPPHGDLIDRNALVKSDRMVGKLMMYGGEYVYTQAEIDRAPTIIPADDKDINVPNKEDGE